MKKSVAFLCFGLWFIHTFAQPDSGVVLRKSYTDCIGTNEEPLPYRPDFGISGNATPESELWRFDRNNGNSIGWHFKTLNEAGNAIVPAFDNISNSTGPSISRTLYSRCMYLETTKKYRLSFKAGVTKEGKTHNLKLYLADDKAATEMYFGDETFLIDSVMNLPLGTTECSVVIDALPSGNKNYRIAFKADSPPGQSQFFLTDFVLEELPPYQLELMNLSNPLSKCNLDNQTISFYVRSQGALTPETYNICYQYNTGEGTPFGAVTCQPFNQVFSYNETREISFSAPRTFTSDVTILKAWISYAAQSTPPDTLQTVIYKTPPYPIPYHCSFDDYAVFKDWSVIPKTAQPDVTWDVPLDDLGRLGGKAVIVTNSSESDDRLISGCIDFEKDTLYKISFTYKANNSIHPERLSCYVGTNNLPQVSDITLMDIQDFNHTELQTVTTYFKPSVSGSYFIGFKAYSIASSAGIELHDVQITTVTPSTTPIYMGFEDYDEQDSWQTFNYTPNATGWQKNYGDAFAESAYDLRTMSATSPTDRNDNWLISKPIQMDAGKPYEILYFRKNNVVGNEYLNVRVTNSANLQAMTHTEPLLTDTITETAYNMQGKHVYFTPSQTGTYYVSFQYIGEVNREILAYGLYLDDISIRDSAAASDTNLSIVELTLASSNLPCSLGSEKVNLIIKNRSAHTIPGGSIRAFIQMNDVLTPTAGYGIQSIGPYESFTKLSNSLAISSAGTYNVRGWISGADIISQNPSDDTSAILNITKINAFSGKYTMGFEADESTKLWTNSQTGLNTNYWWRFSDNQDLVNSGAKAAYLQTTQEVSNSLSQYIGTPCLHLSKDTTYFISFFYRAVDNSSALSQTKVNIYVGTENANYAFQRRDSFIVKDLTYNQLSMYYRPSTTGTHYVIIEGISESYSNGLCIDDFVIVDSLNAYSPTLSIKQLDVNSSNKCDLSPDTLYVHIQNDGFNDYSNPSVKIYYDYKIMTESLTGTIPTGQTKTFKLSNHFSHSKFGVDSVRVWLNIPGNVPKDSDTSAFVKSAKYAPVNQFPYTVTFSDSDAFNWNNLIESYKPGSAFEYWKTGPDSNYAMFENGTPNAKSGLLVSGCLNLQPDSIYAITFRYRTDNGLNSQNLRLIRYKANGEQDTLLSKPTVNNTSYIYDTVNFTAIGDGLEKIAFLCNYTVQSNKIYMDECSIALYVPKTDTVPDICDTCSDPDPDPIAPRMNELSQIVVYPNPATTEIHIKSDQIISTLFIYDMHGRFWNEVRVNHTDYSLNTSRFSAGTYMLVCQIGKYRISHRVVIKNRNP